MTRKQLKDLAKEQIKGKIGVIFVMTIIVAAISFGVSMIPVAGSLASLFITPAISLGWHMVYLAIAKKPEEKPGATDIFGGFNNIIGAFKVNIVVSVFTFLWSLLFIIPGIIKAYAYSQAFYILAENPDIGAREALKKSSAMMQGHKMDYFILNLSFLGWTFLSVFTAGLLLIWLVPYMNATLTNFYNSIKPVEAQPVEEVQFD